MRWIIGFVFVGIVMAQAPAGTITVSNVVTATAGTISCILSNQSPALASGVHMVCAAGGVTRLVMDTVVAPGSTNGSVGSYTEAGASVTWILTQGTVTSPISWQVAANGVGKSGTF